MQAEVNTKELIYLYAFIPTQEYEENKLTDIEGIDPDYNIEYYVFDEVTAVACLVKHEDFAEEVLQKKVEDMKWLQEKAYHHHERMNTLHNTYTVIPLKFGTIYEDKSRLEETLAEHKENIHTVFHKLSSKEEWNIKIFTDKEAFIKEVKENSPEVTKKVQEIEGLSKGKQFFEKKKLKDFIEKQADKEIDKYCESIHEKLETFSADKEVKKNWERKLTGRDDDMCWNGAYLFPKDKVEQVLQFISEEKDKAEKEGSSFKFEITGPWPAYHFSNFQTQGGE
ncbi:GvpL/GvpF family gas vesicle protein [Evansella sp. LMS18]|uniref:GvpL/GvpF family gas vesicle protein n=1 Tax=Evansella sp. LMS18 TaxID=2924033 RepID=UPI0020D03674|nr:GvpL/GvpF family gas vesicle protein [Evansella sp. LMS18]UTR08791.1 GvpL/GvpF family gas vesicle protein [Evansella sp. LMS18]